MKVLQINMTANSGSHGRIAEDIGSLLLENGHEQYIAYGRASNPSLSTLVRIGNKMDLAFHLLISRIFDRHGFGSVRATRSFIRIVEKINPDLIHLQNIHGYYLNVRWLFTYLKACNKPVVWTLHDCWPFTGHCSHFQRVNCYRWQTECHDCPNTQSYPKSWFIDRSRGNYREKKELFTGVGNLVLVTPSAWLAGHLGNSFLSPYRTVIIHNGVDMDKFRPVESSPARTAYNLKNKYVLGVASTWTRQKGLDDFVMLRTFLAGEYDIVLVGLTRKQVKALPKGIRGISRTENTDELAMLYAGAAAFINPTYVDNFPSVNIEALACGTPVITYDTGGSAEAIDAATGIRVEKGNISELHKAVLKVVRSGDNYTSAQCRKRASELFSAHDRFGDYLRLYEGLLTGNAIQHHP